MSLATGNRDAAAPGRLQQELRQNRPFASLQAEAFLNAVRTADHLQHTLRQTLKPYGITETQYNSLRILRGAGEQGLTCSEIAQRLISHDPDITRLLARMERDGLVVRQRDTKDRRLVLTRIAKEGLAKLRELDKVVMETVNRLLGEMTDAELRTMISLLEKARGRSE